MDFFDVLYTVFEEFSGTLNGVDYFVKKLSSAELSDVLIVKLADNVEKIIKPCKGLIERNNLVLFSSVSLSRGLSGEVDVNYGNQYFVKDVSLVSRGKVKFLYGMSEIRSKRVDFFDYKNVFPSFKFGRFFYLINYSYIGFFSKLYSTEYFVKGFSRKIFDTMSIAFKGNKSLTEFFYESLKKKVDREEEYLGDNSLAGNLRVHIISPDFYVVIKGDRGNQGSHLLISKNVKNKIPVGLYYGTSILCSNKTFVMRASIPLIIGFTLRNPNKP